MLNRSYHIRKSKCPNLLLCWNFLKNELLFEMYGTLMENIALFSKFRSFCCQSLVRIGFEVLKASHLINSVRRPITDSNGSLLK